MCVFITPGKFVVIYVIEILNAALFPVFEYSWKFESIE